MSRPPLPRDQRIPLEIAHIEPRKPDGSNDTFENLIALCPTCHTQYDQGHIDRKSMRQYKRNLGVLRGRYGDAERRLLDLITDPFALYEFQRDMTFEFHYLLQDGLLEEAGFERTAMVGPWIAGIWHYVLTDQGREFLARWIDGDEVE